MKKTLLLLFLCSCASQPSLEELKEQAVITGDWTQVEERERMIAKRKKMREPCQGRGRLDKFESMKWGVPVYRCN